MSCPMVADRGVRVVAVERILGSRSLHVVQFPFTKVKFKGNVLKV